MINDGSRPMPNPFQLFSFIFSCKIITTACQKPRLAQNEGALNTDVRACPTDSEKKHATRQLAGCRATRSRFAMLLTLKSLCFPRHDYLLSLSYYHHHTSTCRLSTVIAPRGSLEIPSCNSDCVIISIVYFSCGRNVIFTGLCI